YFAALWVTNEGRFDAEARGLFLDGAPVVAAVQIVAFAASGLYRRAYRYTGIADLAVLTRSLMLACVGSFGALAITRDPATSITSTILDGYFLATLIGGGRFSFRLLEYAARERDARRLV